MVSTQASMCGQLLKVGHFFRALNQAADFGDLGRM